MVYFLTRQAYSPEFGDIRFEDSTETLRLWLQEQDYACVDTEFRDLNFLLPNNHLLTQIGDKDTQFVVDHRYFRLDDVKDYLMSKDFKKVFHNSDIDVNIIKTSHGIATAGQICTFKQSKVRYQGYDYGHGMEECVYRELGIEMDKSQQLSFVRHKGDFRVNQIYYAAMDVVMTDELYLSLLPKIVEEGLQNTFALVNHAPFDRMSRNGIPFDIEGWKKLALENKQRFVARQVELDRLLLRLASDNSVIAQYPGLLMVKDKYRPLDLFSTPLDRLLMINYNSVQQLKPLFEALEILPKKKEGTREEKDTTGKKEVERLKYRKLTRPQLEFVETYLNYADTKAFVSTFGESFLSIEHKDKSTRPVVNPVDNRIHVSFDPVKTTGRIGEFQPNLQQIPGFTIKVAGEEIQPFRRCFRAREGRKICSCDYSSQEGQIMAFQSNDKSYLDFFTKPNSYKGDIHSFVASTMFSKQRGIYVPVSKDVNPLLRQKGKVINFMVSYGGSAYSLSIDLGLPKDECQELIDAFFAGFPMLERMFTLYKEEALSRGYVTINKVTNRKRYFPEYQEYQYYRHTLDTVKLREPDTYWEDIKNKESQLAKINRIAYKLRGDIERAAMNSPIQGTAADMTLTALMLIQKEFDQLNRELSLSDEEGAQLDNAVHDEIETEGPDEHMEKIQQITEEGMAKAGRIFAPGMPLVKGSKVAQYWEK